MTPDTERWASIPDAHDYLISDEGNLRHMLPNGTWRPIRAARNRRAPNAGRRTSEPGWYKVCLGRRRQEYVHRLVWMAFRGPIPDDMQVDHIDNDRTRNSLINLQLLTIEDNARKISRTWEIDSPQDAVA